MPNHSSLFRQALAEQRKYVATLGDGTPVFTKKGPPFIRPGADVEPLLPEAFAGLTLADFEGRDLLKEVHLGRGVVGLAACVKTDASDKIVYRRRSERAAGCSRFVMGREGTPSEVVTVCLYVADENSGLLVAMRAHIGPIVAPEPNAPSARNTRPIWEQACDAWRGQALVFDGHVTDDEFTEADFFGTPP